MTQPAGFADKVGFIWGVADLLRGDVQAHEYGQVVPSAVLHPAGTVALSRTASAGFSVVMGCDMATSQDFVTWTCGPRSRRSACRCRRSRVRDLLRLLDERKRALITARVTGEFDVSTAASRAGDAAVHGVG